jgi:hypothetical protein
MAHRQKYAIAYFSISPLPLWGGAHQRVVQLGPLVEHHFFHRFEGERFYVEAKLG